MSDIHLKNYNMASARLIGGVIFALPLTVLFVYCVLNLSVKSFYDNPEELLMALLVPLGAVAFGWMAVTAIPSLTIGDELTVGTILGARKYPLTDIDQIVFSSETTQMDGVIPVAKHLMMHVMLRPGRHVQVKISHPEAEEVVSALGMRGLDGLFSAQAA